jgi:hypothetical protein
LFISSYIQRAKLSSVPIRRNNQWTIPTSYALEFDRILAGLDGLPDVTHAGPSTIRSVSFIGTGQTFIVSTYRMRDRGDTIFLETISGEGSLRLVIPPAVADAIARQRDTLTAKVRRKVGKASAEARKQRGELPGFMKRRPKA